MSTSLDEDIIVLEQLDFDPECIMCQKMATWIVVFLCCGESVYSCDPCRKHELKLHKYIPERVCLHCKFTWDTREIDNLEWTRL